MNNKYFMTGAIILILFISVINIFYFTSSEKEPKIIGCNYDYAYLLNPDELITLPFLFHDPLLKYITIDNIQSAYLIDENNTIPIRIDDMSDLDQEYTIDHDDFSLFGIRFFIQLDGLDSLHFHDGKLVINYINEDKIKIPIGNISITNNQSIQNNDDLHITSLRGLINEVDEIKTVVGFFINIENISESDITLQTIDILTDEISVSQKDVLINPDPKISYVEPITSLIPNYDLYQLIEETNTDITIPSKTSRFLFVPLIYSDVTYLYRFPIHFEYRMNEGIKDFYFDDFIFFDQVYIPLDTISLLEDGELYDTNQ